MQLFGTPFLHTGKYIVYNESAIVNPSKTKTRSCRQIEALRCRQIEPPRLWSAFP